MTRRIYFDGLNLALEQGTGITTYTRLLAGLVRELGYETGVVYSTPSRPPKNPSLREITFFDAREAKEISAFRRTSSAILDQISYPFGVQPRPLNLSGAVVTDQFRTRMPVQ